MRIAGASEEQKQKRTSRYIRAFGRHLAKIIQWREALGDTSQVSLDFQGTKLYLRLNTTDISVWASVFEREEYGAPMSFCPRFILDAGAYTGFSAVYFARKYPDATIVAVEPDLSNYELLKKNTQSFSNIVSLRKALWFEDGPVQLYDPNMGHWAFTVTPPASQSPSVGQEVEAVTVRTIMAKFGVEVIDILKIDIEGAEKEIFENSRAWIDHVKVIFAELHDRLRPGCTDAFEEATKSFYLDKAGLMTVLAINQIGKSPGFAGETVTV